MKYFISEIAFAGTDRYVTFDRYLKCRCRCRSRRCRRRRHHRDRRRRRRQRRYDATIEETQILLCFFSSKKTYFFAS